MRLLDSRLGDEMKFQALSWYLEEEWFTVSALSAMQAALPIILWTNIWCIVLIGSSFGSGRRFFLTSTDKSLRSLGLTQQPWQSQFYGEIWCWMWANKVRPCIIVLICWSPWKDAAQFVDSSGWRSWPYFIFWRFFLCHRNTSNPYEYSRHQVGNWCASFPTEPPVRFYWATSLTALPGREIKRQTLKPGIEQADTLHLDAIRYWQLGNEWEQINISAGFQEMARQWS